MNNPFYRALDVTNTTDGVPLSETDDIVTFVLKFESGMDVGSIKIGSGDWVRCPTIAGDGLICKNVKASDIRLKVSSGTMKVSLGGWCGD